MTITIKTRLNDGIYKSSGGGETRTHYEWATGPRNLLKAAETLIEHRASMVRCYGNIGCGASWLEIDGVEIHQYDLESLYNPDLLPTGMTRTEQARELLASVAAGTYNVRAYEYADDVDYGTAEL